MSSAQELHNDLCGDAQERCLLTADEMISLLHDKVRLRQALGYFIADDRFQVGVGGNPNVVSAMIERAKSIYRETANPDGEGRVPSSTTEDSQVPGNTPKDPQP